MIIEIQWPESVPRTEFSQWFVQLMANRMAFSFFKYGRMSDAYPKKVDALSSMDDRIRLYRETGNTEHLIDAANFLLIEFTHPSIPGARFRAIETHESPGRIISGERSSDLNVDK